MPQSYQLVMKSGPTPGKIFPLTQQELTIGRDTTNDIVINDAEVSRKHVRIFLQGGGYVLEDLGSTNGSFANGQRLMGPHAMRPGELIMLGENVGLVYEATSMDVDATISASPGQLFTPPPPPVQFAPEPTPEPAYQQPAQARPTPAVQPTPAYIGQVPAGPSEIPEELEPGKKSNTRNWILAGCGCLLILCCVVVAIGYTFDRLQLYCTPPFDVIFRLLNFNCP